MKSSVVANTMSAAAKRPVALAAIDPRTAAARRITGRLLQVSGSVHAKTVTFNSAL